MDTTGNGRKFGEYLRKVRESRRLSLDAVEEMTLGYSGRITKSHLSRIENGQAVPSFPKMFALSQVYGVPIASLAERFEVDLRRDLVSPEIAASPLSVLRPMARKLIEQGRYDKALLIAEEILHRFNGIEILASHRAKAEAESDSSDPHDEQGEQDTRRIWQLHRISCLLHLSRFSMAREECEELLGDPSVTPSQRILGLQYFAMSSHRLGRLTVAMLAVEQLEDELTREQMGASQRAHTAHLKGNLLNTLGRSEEAIEAYSRSIKLYDECGNTFESCRARLNMADALIETDRLAAARRSLRDVVRIAESHRYERILAFALSHLGVAAFKEGQADPAESYFLRSNSIARPREYASVVFRNCFYLWRMAATRGDRAGVRSNERTLRAFLPRVEEHLPEAQAFREHLAGGSA